MAPQCVIEDSDASEDEVTTSAEFADSARPQDTPYQTEESVALNAHDSAAPDPTLAVNFDKFLEPEDGKGSVTFSQQLRESAWLGKGSDAPAPISSGNEPLPLSIS